jgi:hypothetical protein
MLEQATLVIHAWAQMSQVDGTFAWTRRIDNGAGLPLGFLRFVGDPSGSWFAWLRALRLEIFETDDASFLISVTRSWGLLRTWVIQDADEQLVGSIYGDALLTSEKDVAGEIDRDQRRIADSTGKTIATYVENVGRVELTFADLPANPFLRMLILGCVVSLEAKPNR